MFGEKALELVRELKRTQDGNLPPYNEDGIRQVIEEMRSLFEQNQLEVRATTDGEKGLFSGTRVLSMWPLQSVTYYGMTTDYSVIRDALLGHV